MCGTTADNACNPKTKLVSRITEEAATQIRLLLDALGQTDKPKQAERLARAIADMHPCESNWWYACTQNRSRPSRVLDALTLMYS